MNKAHQTLCVFLLCAIFLLCGCTMMRYDRQENTLPTLAPATQSGNAPYGMEGLTEEKTIALYLPSKDGTTLIAQYVTMKLNETDYIEEEVVRLLLAYPTNA